MSDPMFYGFLAFVTVAVAFQYRKQLWGRRLRGKQLRLFNGPRKLLPRRPMYRLEKDASEQRSPEDKGRADWSYEHWIALLGLLVALGLLLIAHFVFGWKGEGD